MSGDAPQYHMTMSDFSARLGYTWRASHINVMWFPEHSDLHKFCLFPWSGPNFFVLVVFSGPIWWIHSRISIFSFLTHKKIIKGNKINWEPFCFEEKKLMSQKPNKFEISILTCLQYSLNISANISSNFKILYIFQQPTERAFR